MKLTKKLVAICAALILVLSLSAVLMLTTGAEDATPTLSIDYCNLSFRNNVCIKYAVAAENAGEVKLLVWTAPQSEYTADTADAILDPAEPETIGGVEYTVFDYTDLAAKQMTDVVYARAYTVVEDQAYYSDVNKYSILQYAYNKLGKTGTATTDAKLISMLEDMLQYGASAQLYFEYKTDTLATDEFVLVESTAGTLEDGFTFGLYKAGTTVTLNAPTAASGKAFHNWNDKNGDPVAYTSTLNITAGTDNASDYTAVYVNTNSTGDFVYELDSVIFEEESVLLPMNVDGNLEDAYKKYGFSLPASYSLVDSGSTYDVYFLADAENIYVFYEFDKKEDIFYPADADATGLKSRHWFDCVDFCLNLAGTTGQTYPPEFRIFGAFEGGIDNIVADCDVTAKGIGDVYVKHTDKGYNVEFTIPLKNVTGTDENGNKMIAFTALSTITTAYNSDPEDGAFIAPDRKYSIAYKAAGAEAKNRPSMLVVKGYDQPAETAPTTTTTENGNYVYEILENPTSTINVDGIRENDYNYNTVHQVPVGSLPTNSTTTYDVYITASNTHIYVLYEFIKAEPIFWDAAYGNKYKLDCVDFVLNLKGAEAQGSEFRIFAGVEGGPGVAVTDCDLAAIGVDWYYVKHTYNGYNVEFSIPLSKVTGKDANNNPQISFTALSTITTAWAGGTADTTRFYTTASNSGNKTQNAAKASPNILVVKDRYTYTLNAGKEALSVDGDMDTAYANGLVWDAKYDTPASYPDNNAVKAHFENPANNTFTVYMTADADYVYILYVVKDEKIVSAADASAWYRADCADIILSVEGKDTIGTGEDSRIFGYKEGGLGTADARDIAKAGITDLYVKKTDIGYNVELKIARSQFTNKNVFSFLAMGGACATTNAETGTTSTTVYPCIDNAAGVGGNTAKGKLNQVVIVDAE